MELAEIAACMNTVVCGAMRQTGAVSVTDCVINQIGAEQGHGISEVWLGHYMLTVPDAD